MRQRETTLAHINRRGWMAGAAALAASACAHGPAGREAPGTLYVLGSKSLMRVDALSGEAVELVGPVVRGNAVNDGIAIDRTAGLIYWSNMGRASESDGTIWRCDMDGKNVSLVVESGQAFTPKQIKLHDGWLYWSDREGMAVKRVNLVSRKIETLVVTGKPYDADKGDQTRWCVGIAIDAARGRLYWSQKGGDDANQGVIRRTRIAVPLDANLASRPDIETLFSALPEPIDLDLDEDANMLYWTDRGDNTVSRAQLRDGAGLQREVLVRGLKEAIGVSLDLRNRRMAYTSLGGEIGVAGMDGGNARLIAEGKGLLTGIAWG